MDAKAKERYRQWKEEIPPNTISWSTFKRLTDTFGIEKGITNAQIILKRKEKKINETN